MIYEIDKVSWHFSFLSSIEKERRQFYYRSLNTQKYNKYINTVWYARYLVNQQNLNQSQCRTFKNKLFIYTGKVVLTYFINTLLQYQKYRRNHFKKALKKSAMFYLNFALEKKLKEQNTRVFQFQILNIADLY